MKSSPALNTIDSELQEQLYRRNQALIDLDETYIATTMPKCPPEIRLCVLHKARYECTEIPAPLRHASGQWLRERDYSRMTGTPLLPKGELPE